MPPLVSAMLVLDENVCKGACVSHLEFWPSLTGTRFVSASHLAPLRQPSCEKVWPCLPLKVWPLLPPFLLHRAAVVSARQEARALLIRSVLGMAIKMVSCTFRSGRGNSSRLLPRSVVLQLIDLWSKGSRGTDPLWIDFPQLLAYL